MSTLFPGGAVEALQRIPMSWEDYLATPESSLIEWVDGVAVASPRPSAGHGLVVVNLGALLKQHLPGLKVISDSGLKMERSLRGPDLMVTTALPVGAWVVDPPVLVVEILSRSTRSEDLLRKPAEYAAAGAGQYWIVDRKNRTLEVYALVDGQWQLFVDFDAGNPTGEVAVGDHGVVPVSLLDLLDG